MLFANVAHFKQTNGDFQVKILFCNTVEDVAIWIRRIGDEARETSKVWEQEEWVKRKWLTDEMTRVSVKGTVCTMPESVNIAFLTVLQRKSEH